MLHISEKKLAAKLADYKDLDKNYKIEVNNVQAQSQEISRLKQLLDLKSHNIDEQDSKYNKLYQQFITTNEKNHKKIEMQHKLYDGLQKQCNEKTDKIAQLNLQFLALKDNNNMLEQSWNERHDKSELAFRRQFAEEKKHYADKYNKQDEKYLLEKDKLQA